MKMSICLKKVIHHSRNLPSISCYVYSMSSSLSDLSHRERICANFVDMPTATQSTRTR